MHVAPANTRSPCPARGEEQVTRAQCVLVLVPQSTCSDPQAESGTTATTLATPGATRLTVHRRDARSRSGVPTRSAWAWLRGQGCGPRDAPAWFCPDLRGPFSWPLSCKCPGHGPLPTSPEDSSRGSAWAAGGRLAAGPLGPAAHADTPARSPLQSCRGGRTRAVSHRAPLRCVTPEGRCRSAGRHTGLPARNRQRSPARGGHRPHSSVRTCPGAPTQGASQGAEAALPVHAGPTCKCLCDTAEARAPQLLLGSQEVLGRPPGLSFLCSGRPRGVEICFSTDRLEQGGANLERDPLHLHNEVQGHPAAEAPHTVSEVCPQFPVSTLNTEVCKCYSSPKDKFL